jgi:hypothetical protein
MKKKAAAIQMSPAQWNKLWGRTKTGAVKRKRTLKKLAPREWHSQKAVFDWALLMGGTPEHPGKYPLLRLLRASMNGIQAAPGVVARAKLCGLKPGEPDIFLSVPISDTDGMRTSEGYRGSYTYHGLYIEQKRRGTKVKEGSLQAWWREQLTSLGYLVLESDSAEKTIRYIKQYLGIKE